MIDLDDLNAGLSRRVRRGLAAANHRSDARFSEAADVAAFSALYDCAMVAKNAASRWRHGLDYFRRYDERVGTRWFFAESKNGKRGLLTIGIGKRAYAHLGGGTTRLAGDSLLAFKSGFSNIRVPLFGYSRVFDAATYAILTSERAAVEIAKFGRESNQHWFPAYRREFL